MIRRIWTYAGLGLAAMLAGCSGGTDVVPLQLELLNAGKQALAERRAAGPKSGKGAPQVRISVSRATLDRLDGSYLEATIERLDVLAYLSVNQQRRDDQPGEITVWRTQDNVTLGMRNGMLISTRGLNGDIMSSAVPAAGATPGPARGGEYVQVIRGKDDQLVRLSFACELKNMGSETIEIIGHRHATRHLQQRCSGAGGEIVNDYWVDPSRNRVWKSRQWAGPHVGYMTFRRLTE